MEHRDAIVSEVIVVVDESTERPLSAIAKDAQAVGLGVDNTDNDNGAIEGTILSNKLPELRAIDGVKYVRITMEYIADYPKGDPRDTDGDMDVDES